MAFWSAFLGAVALDYLSKSWIRANLKLGESRPVIDSLLRLCHWQNPGAAFGIFKNANSYLAVLGGACVIMAIFMYPKLRGFGTLFVISLGLVSGGALGNLIDRIMYGAVTDFISVRYFTPLFNLADSAIVAGSFLLIAAVLFCPKGSVWR